MCANKKKMEELRALRKQGGEWLKAQREGAGMSQRQLASELNLPYYTFISQVESGVGRIPPASYAAWAIALEIPVVRFVHTMLMYYDPIVFDLMFPSRTSV